MALYGRHRESSPSHAASGDLRTAAPHRTACAQGTPSVLRPTARHGMLSPVGEGRLHGRRTYGTYPAV